MYLFIKDAPFPVGGSNWLANGLVLGGFVFPAVLDEREGPKSLLDVAAQKCPRLSNIWADSGYRGPFVDWDRTRFGIAVEITKRTDHLRGFKIVPRKWDGEGNFCWFGHFKQLTKDYELLPEHSESMSYLTMMRLMLCP